MTAMTLRTNICAHCGKNKEEHLPFKKLAPYCGLEYPSRFEDSGLKRLHEKAEELYEAVSKLIEIHNDTISYVQHDPQSNQTFIETTGADALKLEDQITEVESILSTIKTDNHQQK